MTVRKIAHPSIDHRKARAWRPGTGGFSRVIRGGNLPRTALTRLLCWSRTSTCEPDLVSVRPDVLVTRARAHARSWDPVAITEYLCASDAFYKSITGFFERYADQHMQDYQQFVQAIRSRCREAVEGV